MKKVITILGILLFLCTTSAKAQEYLQIVSLETDKGATAVFTSAGIADSKKGVETDAIKSLIYTLFFQGVEGVNDGKPLVSKPNEAYTNTFFNNQARYTPYVVSVEESDKSTKVGGRFQGTMRITLRLRQLINDVRKNTHYDAMLAETPKTRLPKPTIIVVPYKKKGESFESKLENDSDYRIAVGAVQKGLESCDIKTIDLQGRIDAMNRRSQYEDNAGAAESNDKQLLMSSGADVYVTVDLMKDYTAQGARVALVMKAYETASGTIWASEDGWTNRFQTTQTEVLCSYAVKDNLSPFLEQIIKNFSQPARVVLQISISGNSTGSLQDACCANGERIVDFIQNWLDRNAHEGDYHIQGIMDESAIFDYVMIPREDKNGFKMTSSKFAKDLNDQLKAQDVSGTVRFDGNTILLMLDL